MAQRTTTELRVFLDSATDSYDKYVQLSDKSGAVFFDRNRRAVYAEGVLITSDVVDVKVEGSKLMVKKVGNPAYTELADLAIPNVFVKFTENQGLTVAEQKFARANIGVKDAVDNLTSTDTIAPLSANQGKVLKGLIDTNKTKLDGIENGAQKNRVITVNNSTFGDDEQTSEIKISGNLISLPGNGEDGVMTVNLDVEYSSADKRIYFRNGDTDDADNIAEIDVSDFIKDSFVKSGSYNSSEKALILTLVTGKKDDGSDITEEIKIPVGDLIDEYTAGDGLTVDDNQFSVNLGYGLKFDSTKPKKITIDYATNGGIKVDTNGVALQAVANGGITVGATGAAVDWSKAPLRTVNGETIADGNVDTTPKVWKFED